MDVTEYYQTDIREEKRLISRTAMALFVFAIVTFAAQGIIGAVVQLAAPFLMRQEWYIWALSILPMYLIGAPLAYLVLRPVPASAPPKAAMTFGRLLLCLLMCFGIMYPLNLLGTALSGIFGALFGKGAVNPLETVLASGGIFWTLLCGVIIGPCLEELVFRKLIVDRMRRYGDAFAIVFSGVVFGLFHGNLYQFFYACGLGMFFAYIYCRTGKLRYTVFLHMAVNFVGSGLSTLVIRYVDISALNDLDTAALLRGSGEALSKLNGALPGIMLYAGYSILVFGAMIAGIVLLIVRRKRAVLLPGPVTLPRGKAFGTGCLNVGFILYAAFCLLEMALSIAIA